jgi:hypothetical protein
MAAAAAQGRSRPVERLVVEHLAVAEVTQSLRFRLLSFLVP